MLKDNDLMFKDKRKFHLGPKKADFMSQVAKDARFLAKLNIMDYSLLIGIHDRDRRGEAPIAPAAPAPVASTEMQSSASSLVCRSNIPFRRSILSLDVVEGTAMVAKATMDIERMVCDLSIDGIGRSKRSEMYGDATGDSPKDTITCGCLDR